MLLLMLKLFEGSENSQVWVWVSQPESHNFQFSTFLVISLINEEEELLRSQL